jgi:hypothetical protein
MCPPKFCHHRAFCVVPMVVKMHLKAEFPQIVQVLGLLKHIKRDLKWPVMQSLNDSILKNHGAIATDGDFSKLSH